MSTQLAHTTPRSQALTREIDQSRRSGPLKTIVVPPCPALLLQLREAMSQEQPNLTAVSHIAAKDVAMSVTLIRQANGAAHAGKMPVRTVGQAMTRLGLNATAATMLRFLASSAIHADSRHLARFWEQSAQRATAMSALAGQLPGLAPDLAHTCGLFMHVGLPVMLQSVKGYASTMVEGQARRDRSYVQTENANHRTDHAVVGALVARVWQLAPEVMIAVRLHHDLEVLRDEQVEPEVRTLIALNLVSDLLLRRRESLPPDSEWERHGATALEWLQIGADDLDSWHDLVSQALDEV
ncbi:MAG: HDOD domain-containing protein [Rubrivivax sp.]|nr:HDOD domain-containing protein [Rubrivivax sp.]